MYDKGFVYEDYVLSNRIAYELREDGIDLWDFSSEQSAVIYEAAEQGLDVSTFAKPDFSVEQMELMKELRKEKREAQATELEGTLGLQDNGKYRYYSTQRPISPGTYPNGENKPVSIENFDERQPVENGQLQAWGYLEYAEPLSQKEMKDYELKAVSASVTRVNTPEKQTEKKKSVLADLHKKQAQISGVKTPKKEHVKKNEEMQV